MQFRLDGDVFQVQVRNATPFVSRSTGRELRRLSIEFLTRDRATRGRADRFQGDILLEGGLDNAPSKRWRKVGTSSSTSQGDSSSAVHSWEIEEMEALNPSALIIDDLRLQPEQYKERWSDKELEISAIVIVGAEDNLALRQKMAAGEAVLVARVGVADDPRRMEIHNGPWSEQGESCHWLLRFRDVHEEADLKPSAGGLELGRVYHTVPYLLSCFKELEALLVAKGILSDGELKDMKDRAFEKRGDRALDMLKVEDVGQYWSEDD